MLSNHIDHRGNCLWCVGVCPCEQTMGQYREIAGADECNVLLYEHVSEWVSIVCESAWASVLRERLSPFMWSLNLATVSIIVFTVKLLPTGTNTYWIGIKPKAKYWSVGFKYSVPSDSKRVQRAASTSVLLMLSNWHLFCMKGVNQSQQWHVSLSECGPCSLKWNNEVWPSIKVVIKMYRGGIYLPPILRYTLNVSPL